MILFFGGECAFNNKRGAGRGGRRAAGSEWAVSGMGEVKEHKRKGPFSHFPPASLDLGSCCVLVVVVEDIEEDGVHRFTTPEH